MKNFRMICALAALLAMLAIPASAADDFGTVLGNIGKDAAEGYMSPGVTWFGAGMNAGWYNSSKSLTMFKLPVGISVLTINEPFVVIDEGMRKFDFSGNLPAKMIMDPLVGDWNTFVDTLPGGLTTSQKEGLKTIRFVAKDQPTIFGADSQQPVKLRDFLANIDPLIKPYIFAGLGPMLDSTIKLPFQGMDLKGTMPSIFSLTALTLGVKKIPVIDNFQLGLRWIPKKKIGDFGEVGQLGVKVQHEITPHIPFMSKIPFVHASAYWAMNNLDIKIGPAELAQHNWIAMVNGSVDAKFLLGLGLFLGLGYESSSMNLKVDMSEAGLEDFELDIPGKNGFHFQVGARVSLLNFDIYADANYGAITMYNVGITLIGLNGL